MANANINKLISDAGHELREVGIDAGTVEAELILCELLDIERLKLYLDGGTLVMPEILKKFYEIVDKRKTRYPLQYILGSAWFYGRKFIVNESVMVPCPETEILLDCVLRTARQMNKKPVRLLDLGTGSGVVAVSARLENENIEVTASDISDDALGVARENASRLGALDLNFVRSDLFESIDEKLKFDIIASNPPYIKDDDYDGLPPEVKADPQISLLAGSSGMDIIEKLVRQAPDYLNRPGSLIFEIGYDQAELIFEMVDADPRYSGCALLKDLADIDRVVICKLS
ncbi:MAG: peptide chain release factor N(5)-glutamine methyltransferase [candidate division Zixibacteria bacterium]